MRRHSTVLRGLSRALPLMLLLGAPSSQAAEPRARFDQRYEEASRNEQSDVGMEYLPRFSKRFGETFAQHLTACSQETGGPYSKPFTLLLKLGLDGKVSEVLVDSTEAGPVCFARRVQSDVYPVAPRENFWLPGRVRF